MVTYANAVVLVSLEESAELTADVRGLSSLSREVHRGGVGLSCRYLAEP